jgi:imidazoleglycerol-phosphate dehydratase
MARTATVTRTTNETDITVTLELDGSGAVDVATGVPFFDHLLEAFGRHGLFDLTVKAAGDLEIDAHHTVEDVGIVLGQAFAQALGDKRGITRFGSIALPMDEALVIGAVDISGRPYLAYDLPITIELIGTFDTTLAEEFFRAFAMNAGVTLHLKGLAGLNAHHVIEAAAKAAARALRAAVEIDPRVTGVPSTKGSL